MVDTRFGSVNTDEEEQQSKNLSRAERHTRDSTDEESEQGEQTECPECSGALINDEEHAETLCEDCGLVVEADNVDPGPDWRAFNAEEKDEKSRVGAPTTKTLHDKGLSTNIGWKDKDAYGNGLSSRQKQKMKRLRTWNERFRTRDSQERNLKQALGEIQRMASALGLPENVQETSGVIYRKALDDDLLPGRSIEGVATAALHAAAKQAGAPRSMNEIVEVSRVEKMEFTRTYRYINRQLELPVPPTDPVSFVSRFATDLDLSDDAERKARDLLEAAKDQAVHSGKSPVGLAAAAVYAAPLLTREEITQQEVSEVTDVSEVTIRNRYHELLEAYQKA